MEKDLLHSDITRKILGSCFEVHKFLGNGFQELIYQRALCYEFEKFGLAFDREIEQHIFYKEVPSAIGTRRADFVVEKKVLVETKAVAQLDDIHTAQILNYLRSYRLEVGMLVNFGSPSLTYKRLVLSKRESYRG
jgi:GxxExxY protein